ncbi:MAG: aquaporin [Bacteroidota bacterium]
MITTKNLLVEFIGTFTLIFVGIASIVVNAGLVGVALAHGLAIAVMVSAMGYVSGGFFNPAVVVGGLVGGKISLIDSIAYIITELIGGAAGAFAVKVIFPAAMVDAVKLGTPMLASGVEFLPGILMELIMTFFLVIVVYGTAIDPRGPKPVAGLIIGLTITLDIIVGGPITGGSMNPARTFGPAIVGGYWTDHIVYWIGPLAGAILAALCYTKIIGKDAEK